MPPLILAYGSSMEAPLQPAKLLPARLPVPALQVAEAIILAGGRAVVVGGAVRDHLLGFAPKDIDIEVYGLDVERLTAALERVAKIHVVGKSFGVLKAKIGGMEIDVSLPRREKKAGTGHRGFLVDHDPAMSFTEAASRRDFTINAMGVDLGSCELLDPWGGAADLKAGIIRHVSDAFDEDPLRVLRACQFSARYGFAIAPETVAKCRSLQEELATLSTERIWEEFKKLLLKSQTPSVGMAALEATGALALFPELTALCEYPERWLHNNQVLDACAKICRDDKLEDKDALTLLLAALCRRLVGPTKIASDDLPSRALLARMGCPQSWVEGILALVREQAQPFMLWDENRSQPIADGTIRRLALRAPILPLCRLALAEFRASGMDNAAQPCQPVDWLLERASALGVMAHPPQPILQGRDLHALGIKPGPSMGVLLKAAFGAQLDGAFGDLAGALAWAQARIESQTTQPAGTA